jgi:hypothetical protein
VVIIIVSMAAVRRGEASLAEHDGGDSHAVPGAATATAVAAGAKPAKAVALAAGDEISVPTILLLGTGLFVVTILLLLGMSLISHMG